MLSTRVFLSHDPNVSALASQSVHPVHVSKLLVMTPAKSPPHSHDAEPSPDELEFGQGQHTFGLSSGPNFPAAHAVHADPWVIPDPV